MNATAKRGLFLLGAIVFFVLIGLSSVTASENRLVALDRAVQSQWAQVRNAYQRRADLIPNLLAAIKGPATFEKSISTAMTEARIGQTGVAGTNAPNDPTAFAKYEQTQNALTWALSHLIFLSQNDPRLQTTRNFSVLQAQFEGTENRIAVERMRYNEAAQTFNTTRKMFPMVLVAGSLGNRFAEKAYFQSPAGGW